MSNRRPPQGRTRRNEQALTIIVGFVHGFYGPDAETRRRRLLIVKHGILLALFGAGTIWQWSLAFGERASVTFITRRGSWLAE